MRKIKRIGFLIAVLFLTCCSNNNDFSKDGNASVFSSNESLSGNEKPSSNDSYTTTIDDYLNYCKNINDGSSIYCWRNENSYYRSGLFKPSSSSYPSFDSIKKMQEETPCPLPIMAQIIEENCEQKRVNIIEIDYPLSEQCYGEILCLPVGRYSSRNKEIYSLLNILDTYDYYFGKNGEYFNLYNDLDNSDSVETRTYLKYLFASSYVYCWKNDNSDDYAFGISCEPNDQCVFYGWVDYMQNILPCSKNDIKRIIQLFYRHYSSPMQNLLVEIPFISNYLQYKQDILEKYPNNLSVVDNKSLYTELGLIESYNSFFGD